MESRIPSSSALELFYTNRATPRIEKEPPVRQPPLYGVDQCCVIIHKIGLFFTKIFLSQRHFTIHNSVSFIRKGFQTEIMRHNDNRLLVLLG